MAKRQLILIGSGLGIILLVVVMGRLLSAKKPAEKIPVTAPIVTPALPKETAVNLTDTGFSPQEVTISVGGAVRFMNQSSQAKASVNSDDYPTNRKFPELNLGVFQKGSTLVHIFNKAGTYTYHNQFHPDQKGTVVVH